MKVTGIETEGAVPEVGVNVIFPEYVWGLKMPGVAVMFTDPGVPAVPVANVSHAAFESAVQPRLELVLLGLVIATVCETGVAASYRVRERERCW